MTTEALRAYTARNGSHGFGSSRRLTALTLIAAAVGLTLSATATSAQLTSDQRKCIKLVANRARVIANYEQKKSLACAKNGTGDITACINQPATKTAAQAAKLGGYYLPAGYCGTLPPFGLHAFPDRIIDTVADGAGDIARGIFGDPVDDIQDIKCHEKLANNAGKKYYAILNRFFSCTNAIESLTAVSQLEACIAAALQNDGVLDRQGILDSDVNERCADDYGIPPSGTGDGACGGATTSVAFSDCVGALVNCEACQAINATVDTSADCELLDDGLANGSCPADLLHTCTFGARETSWLSIHYGELPLLLSVKGSSIDIGGAGSTARCAVHNFQPISIPGVGTLCVQPGPACPDGTRWCGPGAGPPLGVGVISDANVGTCTSQSACATSCASACPLQYGAGAVASASSCTGRCSGGSGATVCSTDAQCAGLGEGSCGGTSHLALDAHDVCQCTCRLPQVNSSAAGDMQCQLGVHLSLEDSPPCDGIDVFDDLGTSCMPLTTQFAYSYVQDANDISGYSVPSNLLENFHIGAGLSCGTVDDSTLVGLGIAGATTALDTLVFADMAIGLTATCAGICGDGDLDPGEICDGSERGPCLHGCSSSCTCVAQSCEAFVGGSCWFLGDPGASCDATCTANGRVYDPATETFAGSGGSNENCTAVLAGLGDPASFVGGQNCAVVSQTGTGCRTNGTFSSRCTAPTTTAEATNPGTSRACACE